MCLDRRLSFDLPLLITETDGTTTEAPPEPPACSDKYHNDPECEWDDHEHECVTSDQNEQTTTEATTTTEAPPEPPACDTYHNKKKCKHDPGCEWDNQEHECVTSDPNGPAMVTKDFRCTVADGNGIFVRAEGSIEINTNSETGVTVLKCKASGLPNDTGEPVKYDFDSTGGALCSTEIGLTSNWRQIVSASGEATLTCKVGPNKP